jgi:DNA-binding winged helix-turn-helix (wHTH) protein
VFLLVNANNHVQMKGKMLSLIVAGAVLLLVGFVTKQTSKTDFDSAKEMVVMRQIAHSVLLYSKDSTTQVSPINRISENEFQIPFHSSFSFKPDSLVAIIDRIINHNNLPSDYIVQVTEPLSEKVIFGYAILGSEQENIVPCIGRTQPSRPYNILISFRDKPFRAATWLIFGGGLLLASALFIAFRRRKQEVVTEEVLETEQTEEPIEPENSINNQPVNIGGYLFFEQTQRLVFGSEQMNLTSKEAKVLSILAAEPNQIVDRNRIQKEVWEDEGVIVGRSLDVFISKLRKKLDLDAAVKIISIHGKGYKLQINEV